MAIVLDGTNGITTPALNTDTKISPADLGTGTPDATNFLRGDGSWQVISTTPTTAQVLAATAGASVGAVGAYAFLATSTVVDTSPGSTIAGSNLLYSSAAGGTNASVNPSGTWYCMGRTVSVAAAGGTNRATLWLRIS
jgi:hypothetical protein